MQKKTGEVAKDVDGEGEEKSTRTKGKKAAVKEEDGDEVESEDDVEAPKRKKSKKIEATEGEATISDSKPSKPARRRSQAVKEDADNAAPPDQPNGTNFGLQGELPERKKTKRKPAKDPEKNSKAPRVEKAARPDTKEEASGRRRSARVSEAAK